MLGGGRTGDPLPPSSSFSLPLLLFELLRPLDDCMNTRNVVLNNF